jgi:DNA-binding protein
MPPKRGPAPPNPGRPDGNVQVGRNRSNFVYADLTKHLLANGQETVEVSALGSIISDAVAVVEMLKNQGLVSVHKIETSRGAGTNARSESTDKISIWVKKTPGFKTEYERQMKERKEKADRGEEEKAE